MFLDEVRANHPCHLLSEHALATTYIICYQTDVCCQAPLQANYVKTNTQRGLNEAIPLSTYKM